MAAGSWYIRSVSHPSADDRSPPVGREWKLMVFVFAPRKRNGGVAHAVVVRTVCAVAGTMPGRRHQTRRAAGRVDSYDDRDGALRCTSTTRRRRPPLPSSPPHATGSSQRTVLHDALLQLSIIALYHRHYHHHHLYYYYYYYYYYHLSSRSSSSSRRLSVSSAYWY